MNLHYADVCILFDALFSEVNGKISLFNSDPLSSFGWCSPKKSNFRRKKCCNFVNKNRNAYTQPNGIKRNEKRNSLDRELYGFRLSMWMHWTNFIMLNAYAYKLILERLWSVCFFLFPYTHLTMSTVNRFTVWRNRTKTELAELDIECVVMRRVHWSVSHDISIFCAYFIRHSSIFQTTIAPCLVIK